MSQTNGHKRNSSTLPTPRSLHVLEELFSSLKSLAEGLVNNELLRGLTRSLLISRVKLQPTVELAIEWYGYACEDHAEAEACLEKLVQCLQTTKGSGKTREAIIESVSDLPTRFSRHRQHWRDVLNEFDVEIDTVEVGDAYDPEKHTQIGTAKAEQSDDRSHIAAVERQRFTWRDEFGLEQSMPARVIVFD